MSMRGGDQVRGLSGAAAGTRGTAWAFGSGEAPAGFVHRYGESGSVGVSFGLPEGARQERGPVGGSFTGWWRARYMTVTGRPAGGGHGGRAGRRVEPMEEVPAGTSRGRRHGTFEDVGAWDEPSCDVPVDTPGWIAVGQQRGRAPWRPWGGGRGKLRRASWRARGGEQGPAGRERPGVRTRLSGVRVVPAGVLRLTTAARKRVGGGTAAPRPHGRRPGSWPFFFEEYRIAGPDSAGWRLVSPCALPCTHAETGSAYSYSERYATAATAAGGRRQHVRETPGGQLQRLFDPA